MAASAKDLNQEKDTQKQFNPIPVKIKLSKINYKDLSQAKSEKEIMLWVQNDLVIHEITPVFVQSVKLTLQVY